MGFDSLHESVVTDILNFMKDGVQWVDGKLKPKSPKIRTAGSLARATSGLTLVFPVICTDTLDIETATMVSKAIERKNIALLQMAFSAYNITNATDAISHLSKFHTNLDYDKLTVDKFMDFMETVEESSYMYPDEIAMVNEDCKRNCNFTMGESINYHSLLEYSQVNRFGHNMIVYEALPNIGDWDDAKMYQYYNNRHGRNTEDDTYIDKWVDDKLQRDRDKERYDHDDEMRRKDFEHQKELEGIRSRNASKRDKTNFDHQKTLERLRQDNQKELEGIKDKNATARDQARRDFDAQQNDIQNRIRASDSKRQQLSNQLVPSEVKKANEMQPSLMIVNFYVNDKDRDLNIAQQIVAGVKSKLYPISSSDIINKIITKTVDSDIILKLVKVSTREISFVRDFLLGLDDANLTALSKSKKGSGSALFNALEKRALKGKIRKTLKLENSAKAISTLVITVEEAEELKKYNNIDIMNAKIVANFMNIMNLLYFVVVDSTAEAIHIFTDGDSHYESLSFSALERESGDGAYKKVIKLMTSTNMR